VYKVTSKVAVNVATTTKATLYSVTGRATCMKYGTHTNILLSVVFLCNILSWGQLTLR